MTRWRACTAGWICERTFSQAPGIRLQTFGFWLFIPMIRYIKVLIFLACLVPLGHLLWGFFGRTPLDMTTWGVGLGANPIEKITHATGDWTLRFLLITLAVTPLRKLLGLP